MLMETSVTSQLLLIVLFLSQRNKNSVCLEMPAKGRDKKNKDVILDRQGGGTLRQAAIGQTDKKY